ncbi:MAG: RNA polymerase factor sigma-54 [Bacteroidetes bacterium]|nr:RNA polymerase factor sigma-54 [Bacteroidota bacterium]
MLRQSAQQRLQQRLSPQQIQIMKLLQVPTVNLEERIKEEMEENPALEYETDSPQKEDDLYDFEKNAQDDSSGTVDDIDDEVALSDDTADKVDIDDYLRGEDSGAYGSDYNADDYDNDRQPIPIRLETSFHEHLLGQLGLLELDEREAVIAEQIIGSIDDDGYLRRETHAIVDDLAFSRNIQTDETEVSSILGKIQSGFEPAGVGAWSLQECLVLQLQRISPQTNESRSAITLIQKYFNEFSKKHYEKVQRQLGLKDDAFKNVITLITRLTPKPGAAFGTVNKAETYVIPDFFVANNNGNLELTLNSKNAPELRVSEGYREMLTAYERGDKKDKRQREAVQFIKQKLDAAKWFIDAIRQRQHTLIFTMQAIIDIQQEFFLTGDDATMKPMILKDVAEITKLDISTVSRVANSKYVQTEFGTYKLKYFFSESMQTDSGEEVSTREVKSILAGFINDEDKQHPLSDDRLTELLQEKGYNIARRTVAKYREQLNVPVARLRKEL